MNNSYSSECANCKKWYRFEQLIANDEGKMLCENCYRKENS